MTKIAKLTVEQEADLSDTRNKWLAVGLSTAPIDRDAAKAAVVKMYDCAGLPAPKVFIFLDSPLQGAMAAAALTGGMFEEQVRDQVRDQVRAQVWAQVGEQVWGQVWAAVYGAHDAAWLGFYDFFHRHFDLAGKASGLMEVAKNCGWVWPFARCAIITDRPTTIVFDDEKRLHCATGPAIGYRDGFTVHAWHGVRIPADWLNGGISPKDAVTWPNVEQRRAAIEVLGWPNILSELGAKSLGGNPDPKIGELIEVQLPFEDEDGNATTRALFLKAQCGTGRTIFEAVDPDEIDLDPRFDPAWCAQAWRDGYAPADWLPPSFRT